MGWTTRKDLQSVKDIFTVENNETNAQSRSYSNYTLDKCMNMNELTMMLSSLVDNHFKI